MRGIVLKSIREAWVPTLLFAVALMLVEGLITFILPQVSREMSEIWLQMPMMKQMLTALLGTDLGEGSDAAGHKPVVGSHMAGAARGRETDSTGLHRFLNDADHRR